MGKSELDIACEEMGIEVTARHVALETDERGWMYDLWVCTLYCEGRTASFEYKTGIGHRTLAPMVQRSGDKFWFSNSGDTAHSVEQAAARNMLILPRYKSDVGVNKRGSFKGPSVGDIISSLISDSSAMEETFDDWCSTYEYNNDSLKALNLYLTCQRIGKKLYSLLGHNNMMALRDKEH